MNDNQSFVWYISRPNFLFYSLLEKIKGWEWERYVPRYRLFDFRSAPPRTTCVTKRVTNKDGMNSST